MQPAIGEATESLPESPCLFKVVRNRGQKVAQDQRGRLEAVAIDSTAAGRWNGVLLGEEFPMEIDATKVGAFVIYRPAGSPIKITGGSVSIDVKDGALVVFSGGTLLFALAAGQWITVNVEPDQNVDFSKKKIDYGSSGIA
jgi:hypothetical protein